MCDLYQQICLVTEFMEAEKHYKSEVISHAYWLTDEYWREAMQKLTWTLDILIFDTPHVQYILDPYHNPSQFTKWSQYSFLYVACSLLSSLSVRAAPVSGSSRKE